MIGYFDINNLAQEHAIPGAIGRDTELGITTTPSGGIFLYGSTTEHDIYFRLDDTKEIPESLKIDREETKKQLAKYGITEKLINEIKKSPYEFINENNLAYKCRFKIDDTETTINMVITPDGAHIEATNGTHKNQMDIAPEYLSKITDSKALYELLEQITPYETNELSKLMEREIINITKNLSDATEAYNSTPYANIDMTSTFEPYETYELGTTNPPEQ